MGEQSNNIDRWQKPPNAPDHPRWNPEYRQRTERYWSDAKFVSGSLFGMWLKQSEQMTPANMVVELEVFKTRNRGPFKEPKTTDDITLFDVWAAATWDPMEFRSSPTSSAHLASKTERHERFEETLREAYATYEQP